jgi:hydrogenase maturation protease
MKTVIIGAGNPYRGDDAAGCAVAGLLAARLPASGETVCREEHAGGLRLMEAMQGFERCILIDAFETGHPAGTVHRREGVSWREARNTNSSHDMSLADALALGRLAGLSLPERIVFWGIEPGSMEGCSAELTPAVRDAVARVALLIEAELLAWSQTEERR